MTEKKKVLVVGAGITGATIAYLLNKTDNYNITVIEKQSTVGGACSDSFNNCSYLQEHGPHIFHTKSILVWNFISQFVSWFPYTHKVKSLIKDKYVDFPINQNSINDILGGIPEYRNFAEGKNYSFEELQNNENIGVQRLGDLIFDYAFRNYSQKQWGAIPDKEVLGRVTAYRNSKVDAYFPDEYQGIPLDGYTTMVVLMTMGIELHTEKTVTPDMLSEYDHVFYTGSLDELCDYELGELPYRSCKFDNHLYSGRYLQQCAVINYPNDYAYTRSTDYSYFNPFCDNGIVTYEYPCAYNKNDTTLTRYYPIKSEENLKLYESYVKLVSEKYPNVIPAGRLGTYKYLNMDAAIEQAFNTVEKFLI